MHPNACAKGRWNILLHQSCTSYLTPNSWAQGPPRQETEGAPWERQKEVLAWRLFRRSRPALPSACFTWRLYARLQKETLLKDASFILTVLYCYHVASSPVLLKKTKRVLKEGRQLSSGRLFWGRRFPPHHHVSPGTCQLSPCSPVHMYWETYGHGHVLISA